ncbi:hypothetical protein K8B33_15970 [Alcanivorax sp. JB21]|uniref:hypothetical protein n=1 Tax=Alcanivorax limicola TaxID=2874102 RepID=UPI001CBC2887|nr:hypothetical protein [Alcanivorax limicola]MBZ2190599.1 hypothetical protein [Alcanivorax limicola]
MNLKHYGDTLILNNGRQIRMPAEVKKAVSVENFIAVLLRVPEGMVSNDNIIFFSERNPEKRWKSADPYPDETDSPFVNIEESGHKITAYTWIGERITIEPATGKILNRRETK